jgi:hypothetical protein
LERGAFIVVLCASIVNLVEGSARKAAAGPIAASTELALAQDAPKTADFVPRPVANEGALVLEAEVVDPEKRPIPGAQVVVSVSYSRGTEEPDVVTERRVADARGRVRLEVARERPGATLNTAAFWAYTPGRAMQFTTIPLGDKASPPTSSLILDKPAKWTVTVRGADDEPMAGLRVTPRVLLRTVGAGAMRYLVPEDFAESLTATTDTSGAAALTDLPQITVPRAVRISGVDLASQTLPLDPPQGRDFVLKLGRPGRLVGIVRTQDGQPLPDASVDVWIQGSGNYRHIFGSQEKITPEELLRFGAGPLKTGSQGAFQTPARLFSGSTYRVAIRHDEFERYLSEWVKLENERFTVSAVRLRRLQTAHGEVRDRQGRPVAAARVFTPAQGPATVTDQFGRFTLAGVRSAPVILLAEQPGFRLTGRLVDLSATSEVGIVTLARADESPGTVVKPIADPLPADELRKLAYRLLEPLLQERPEENDTGLRLRAIEALGTFDVERARGLFREGNFRERDNYGLAHYQAVQRSLAARLVEKDPAGALAMVESIPDLGLRMNAWLALAEALPATEHVRKQALLDRATTLLMDRLASEDARVHLQRIAKVAEHWQEFGDRERAHRVISTGKVLIDKLTPSGRPYQTGFPGQFARFEPVEALAWLKKLPKSTARDMEAAAVAAALAFEHPDQAEEVLNSLDFGVRPTTHGDVLRVCRRTARVDPTRATRIAAAFGSPGQRACAWAAVALGLSDRGRAGVTQAVDHVLDEIDQIRKSGPGPVQSWLVSGVREMYPTNPAAVILPIVECLAPDRLDEVFWRAVALHPPIEPDHEDQLRTSYIGNECTVLAHYDRALAAALFEPTRAYLSAVAMRKETEGGFTMGQIIAMGCLDPMAAVEHLESLSPPANVSLNSSVINARLQLARIWGIPSDERWRQLFQSAQAGLAFGD